mgnify:CR=1 FL=1
MAATTRDAGEIAVAFTRVQRGAGIDVPTSSTIAFGEGYFRISLTYPDDSIRKALSRITEG